MADPAALHKRDCDEINLELFPIKVGDSVKQRLKKSSRTVHGYSQFNPIERALGYMHPTEISMHPISASVLNSSDIRYAVEWLLENGFDIVKIK